MTLDTAPKSGPEECRERHMFLQQPVGGAGAGRPVTRSAADKPPEREDDCAVEDLLDRLGRAVPDAQLQ